MTGTQAIYNGKKVTILRVTKTEVLILNKRSTKWVDRELFNLLSNKKV